MIRDGTKTLDVETIETEPECFVLVTPHIRPRRSQYLDLGGGTLRGVHIQRALVAGEEVDEPGTTGAIGIEAWQSYAHGHKGDRPKLDRGVVTLGLEDDPFDYRMTKSGLIIIVRNGRTVMEIGGKKASALIAKLGAGYESDQQLLARVTGNYRRGNERHINRPH
ncbi:hypothetical protein SAMN04489751_0173 [Brevibacterium sandarakinum]|uniref:Uncharacterized protein n=1 Tax=Brevibacterium sandarakinum TaxID=629680 RepID=A0A1H1L9E1_BRESA|nr:hypothetical protein [Brevibacterium sandarakinum]SDR71221.1 hypothetical protein SAMN04489751_0173 [Brevibacterium sandarakinum]